MSVGRYATGNEDSSWRRLINNSMPALIWSIDVNMLVATCAGPLAQVLGRQPADVIGRPVSEMFPSDVDVPALTELHRRALLGNDESLTFELSDHVFHGPLVPLRDGSNVVGAVATLLPIRALDARCEAVAVTAEERIIFMTLDGVVEFVNRTPRRLTVEEVVGKSMYEFLPDDSHEAYRRAMEQVLETARPVSFEVCFRRNLQEESWQSMRIGPVRDQDRIIGFVLLSHDVTRYKKSLDKMEAEEKFLRHLLDLQDRERRMVAYEIHDGFIQDVIGARMILQGLAAGNAGKDVDAPAAIQRATELLGRSIDDSRRLISELRPMIIDEMGIVEAVEYLVSEEQSRGDLDVTFEHRVEAEFLPPLLQATVVRIIREALTNARRHGKATQAEIRLTMVAKQFLILEISDNGIGFDPTTVPGDRFGLAGIKERAELFEGGATIESGIGEGTRITVKMGITASEPEPESPGNGIQWTV